MIDDNAKIESMLKRYRPSGPSAELKERIFQQKETKAADFSLSDKNKKTHWIKYAAIAASILIVAGSYLLWDRETDVMPSETQLSFAEIDRQISQSANAARLLAAVDMLAQYSNSEDIIKQQYCYIVDMYPQTPAAAKAKLQIK